LDIDSKSFSCCYLPLPGQEWKKYNLDNATSTDGFPVRTSYIGRGTTKCINGCDYEVGRIQTDPGVFYLDELSETEKFDNTTVEYLVKNPNYTYRWVPSRSGVKVENALELHKEGHYPFYIGKIRVNEDMFIGKVKPGEGIFFVGPNGKQVTISSYSVLTCTSSDASNGVYEEKSDEDWFSTFGCPVRKSWSFKQWRCVCNDEFKHIFVTSGAKWDEATCSYSM
jgi:hypothetical protein